MADELDRIAAALEAQGQRPTIDRDLWLVLSDCAECRLQDQDAARLHRPRRWIPRASGMRSICSGCSVEYRSVKPAAAL